VNQQLCLGHRWYSRKNILNISGVCYKKGKYWFKARVAKTYFPFLNGQNLKL
jgi:hypothetical protein